MTAIHKKLAINNLPSIDFYDDKMHWKASISEMEPGWWSVKINSATYFGRFDSYDDALRDVYFWTDTVAETNDGTYIKE